MDSDPVLFRALATAERANLGISLLVNLLVLFLVVRRSNDMGNYRFLLFAFVVNDIYFTLIHSLTLPIACTFGDAFVIFASGTWNSQLSIAYYAATFSQTMPLLMHLFIYRSQRTSFYTPINTAMLLLGIVLVESNIWYWGSYFLYMPDVEAREYLKQFFIGDFAGFEYLAQLYWESCDLFRDAVRESAYDREKEDMKGRNN